MKRCIVILREIPESTPIEVSPLLENNTNTKIFVGVIAARDFILLNVIILLNV